MTIQEFRNSEEFVNALSKIIAYRKGFKFSIPFYKMTQGQKNAMREVLREATKRGLIENVSTDLNLNLEITEEGYKRI